MERTSRLNGRALGKRRLLGRNDGLQVGGFSMPKRVGERPSRTHAPLGPDREKTRRTWSVRRSVDALGSLLDPFNPLDGLRVADPAR